MVAHYLTYSPSRAKRLRTSLVYVASKFRVPAKKSKKEAQATLSEGCKPYGSVPVIATSSSSASASPSSTPKYIHSLRTSSYADDGNNVLPSCAATPLFYSSSSSSHAATAIHFAAVVAGLKATEDTTCSFSANCSHRKFAAFDESAAKNPMVCVCTPRPFLNFISK